VTISRDTVLYVARLARLKLEPDEIDTMQRDLGRILDYVNQLAEVPVAGVEPRTTIAVHRAPFRPDVAQPSLEPEVAQREASRQTEGGFLVPGFVEE
jgi:aspartyl-tRNA(Asn)/glutamyl-tRNA(Gln) amidotransferase subunit C